MRRPLDTPSPPRAAPRTGTLRGRGVGVLRVGLMALSSAGCQTYNDKTSAAFSDFEQGRFEAAMTTYGEGEVVDSPFLAGAEAGTVGIP